MPYWSSLLVRSDVSFLSSANMALSLRLWKCTVNELNQGNLLKGGRHRAVIILILELSLDVLGL